LFAGFYIRTLTAKVSSLGAVDRPWLLAPLEGLSIASDYGPVSVRETAARDDPFATTSKNKPRNVLDTYINV
jgi:hypothetical protein